jgi:hypothetical protein
VTNRHSIWKKDLLLYLNEKKSICMQNECGQASKKPL